MRAKHHETLQAVFRNPVSGTIKWREIENLLVAVGCDVSEGSGSRVRFTMNGRTLFIHRPHPTPDAKRYVVRLIREFLDQAGVRP
jgi:hypothetical protein